MKKLALNTMNTVNVSAAAWSVGVVCAGMCTKISPKGVIS